MVLPATATVAATDAMNTTIANSGSNRATAAPSASPAGREGTAGSDGGRTEPLIRTSAGRHGGSAGSATSPLLHEAQAEGSAATAIHGRLPSAPERSRTGTREAARGTEPRRQRRCS